MQFETTIYGQYVDLERLTNDHISELELIAFDERIWQNLPYNITNKQSLKHSSKNSYRKI